MICFGKIQLCATSHNCIFWVLDNFYCHKNFMGSYYTPYTIFYNSFYVPNIIKILVLISFYLLWPKLKKNSLDRFQLVVVPVFWYFRIRKPVAVACCPFLGQKNRLDQTCEHYLLLSSRIVVTSLHGSRNLSKTSRCLENVVAYWKMKKKKNWDKKMAWATLSHSRAAQKGSLSYIKQKPNIWLGSSSGKAQLINSSAQSQAGGNTT